MIRCHVCVRFLQGWLKRQLWISLPQKAIMSSGQEEPAAAQEVPEVPEGPEAGDDSPDEAGPLRDEAASFEALAALQKGARLKKPGTTFELPEPLALRPGTPRFGRASLVSRSRGYVPNAAAAADSTAAARGGDRATSSRLPIGTTRLRLLQADEEPEDGAEYTLCWGRSDVVHEAAAIALLGQLNAIWAAADVRVCGAVVMLLSFLLSLLFVILIILVLSLSIYTYLHIYIYI